MIFAELLVLWCVDDMCNIGWQRYRFPSLSDVLRYCIEVQKYRIAGFGRDLWNSSHPATLLQHNIAQYYAKSFEIKMVTWFSGACRIYFVCLFDLLSPVRLESGEEANLYDFVTYISFSLRW